VWLVNFVVAFVSVAVEALIVSQSSLDLASISIFMGQDKWQESIASPSAPFHPCWRGLVQMWASWGWCINLQVGIAFRRGSSGEPNYCISPGVPWV
jgi:hypothetical protein